MIKLTMPLGMPPNTGQADGHAEEDGELARFLDVQNGKRLVEVHGHDLRFCADLGGWMAWVGTRWARARAGEADAFAKHVAMLNLAEAQTELGSAKLDLDRLIAAKGKTSKKKKEQVRKATQRVVSAEKARGVAARSQSAERVRAMLAMAVSERGVAVGPDRFDADPYLFNLENGTLDLRTGELHAHRREDLLTKLAPVTFDPAAPRPRFDAFLEQIMPDVTVRDFLKRLFGSSLVGEVRDHILPICYGDGSNGKTTLLNTLLGMMGDYGRQVPAEMLMVRKNEPHPTERADLRGLRLAIASESDQSAHLAEATVKALTGGDPIVAHFMRQDYFTFIPSHTLVLCTNHRPEIRGVDNAIWRRIALVSFEVSIAKEDVDTALPEVLKAERAGIFNWALEGCLQWQRDGRLILPETIVKATEEYRAEQDDLAGFISELCRRGSDFSDTSTHLYQAYETWLTGLPKGDSHLRLSHKAFGAALVARGFRRKKTGGISWYMGIASKLPTARPARHEKEDYSDMEAEPSSEDSDELN